METREIFVSYWDKEYLDSQFPERKNTPYFQLSEGEIGLPACVSESKDFAELVLDFSNFLNKPTSLKYTYRINFSKDAILNINKTKKKALEKIVSLHNDFVTARRS